MLPVYLFSLNSLTNLISQRNWLKEFHLKEDVCKEEELKRRGGKKMDSPNAESNVEALKQIWKRFS